MKKNKPAEKNKNPAFSPTEVGAMLEAIHNDIKTVSEGHSGLDKRLEDIERELHGNSRRLDMIELTSRTSGDRIGRLEDALSKLSKDLKDTRQSLEAKITTLGDRLTSVETSR